MDLSSSSSTLSRSFGHVLVKLFRVIFVIQMGDLRRGHGDGGGHQMNEEEHILFPKPEALDLDAPCDTHTGDNAATSSRSHVKSLLMEMGFSSTLVQKAIDENGVDDLESLVEILTNTIVTEHPQPKQEPDIQSEADGTRMMLLTMKFPQNLVDLALSTLGKDAPIDEMVDFIGAAQLAGKYAEESEDLLDGTETNREDEDVVLATEVPIELLFDKTDKTLQLLEMGFSHHQISMAIEKIGKEGQISDLAESIITGEVPGDLPDDLEDIEMKVSAAPACPSKSWRFVGVSAQKKDGDESYSNDTTNVRQKSTGKRIKVEAKGERDFDDRGKRLRRSFMETTGTQDESKEKSYEFPSAMQPRVSQIRPYFFYGNIVEVSPQWWSKISRLFFGFQPEHVDTRLCSGLCRKEGYVHNLPIENRFHIPSEPSPNIISLVEPESLECIMGYPRNHTNIGRGSLAERLKLLDYCFQTDTLGYHLSVLKPMFPQGLTVLSLFSGIGGAEIALSRLGIHLKGVYSVETCGLSRNILKRWWETSGQTGELVQIEDIRTLTTKKLETLVQRFGGFDLVICQNPPTPPDLSKETSKREASKFDYMLFNEVVRVSNRVKELMKPS